MSRIIHKLACVIVIYANHIIWVEIWNFTIFRQNKEIEFVRIKPAKFEKFYQNSQRLFEECLNVVLSNWKDRAVVYRSLKTYLEGQLITFNKVQLYL